MTTEAGVEKPSKVRKNIEALRRRLEYIEGRVDARVAAGKDVSWDRAEIAALTWALPVLEAEWDHLVRRVREGVSR